MYRKAGQSISRIRRLDEVLIRSQKAPSGTQVSPVELKGVTGDWIRGPEAGTGAGPEAAVLYLHGGAFVSGSPATHRELAARVSAAGGVPVFSPEYRLAPEHPFPAAIEDALSVYQWLQDEGYPPSRVVIGGESSGGGLALQALLTMKQQRMELPRAAFFLSPVTGWSGLEGDSYSSRASKDPLLSAAQCRFTAAAYVGESPKKTPLLRPAEMDLAGLPPMWIHVGDHEILLSDSQRLAHRAEMSGVDVEFKVWPGLWHVFQTAARLVPEAKTSLEDLGRFIREHLG
jgi:acetyl esterase/lipase